MRVSLDILIGTEFRLLSAKCPVSGLNSTVFTARDAGLWSPLTARCTNEPDSCGGKSVIDSQLRAPWEPFAAPNAKIRTVLQSSDTNSCGSTRSSLHVRSSFSAVCTVVWRVGLKGRLCTV